MKKMEEAVSIEILTERLFDTSTIANELHKLAYDIENVSIYDSDLILRFEEFIASYPSSIYNEIKKFKIGHDNYSFLHHAAKCIRPSLLNYLINKLEIPIDMPSKTLMTPLHVLVKQYVNDQETYKRVFDVLAENRADVNAKDESGMSVLQHAVSKNNFYAVLLLLSAKNLRVPKSVDQFIMSPLHEACKEGHDEIAFSLIDYLSETALTELYNHDMPIHLVLDHREEKLALVKRMFEKLSTSKRLSTTSNNVNTQMLLYATNHENRTILQLAIDRGHTNIAKMIVTDYYPPGFCADGNGNTPMHLVAESGNVELLNILSNLDGLDYSGNSSNNNPLHLAAAKNRFEFINTFLKLEKENTENTDSYIPCALQTNDDFHTPLIVAVQNDRLKCVEALLKSKETEQSQLFAMDREGNTIVHMCARQNLVEVLRQLLLKHAKVLDTIFIPNNVKELPLHIAASLGNIEIFKLILSRFLDGPLSNLEKYLSSRNDSGKNCFHLVCEKGHFNIAEYLIKDLKLQFLVEIPDCDSNTPLHLVAMNGFPMVTELLCNHKADILKQNVDGSTALELSCHRKFFHVSKIIIDSCETLSTKSSRFKPLHIASKEGAYEIVELLLLKGVAIDSFNEEGLNALDLAIENNQKEVIKVLLKHEDWKMLFETKPKDQKLIKRFKPFLYLDMEDLLTFNQRERVKSENPQMVSLFEKKMWHVYSIIFDNSSNDNGSYDFSILNPPLVTIEHHPLMLVARSGQETLLKHDAVKKLLSLKWFMIPRLLFYMHLLFYTLFICVFGLYSIELTDLNFANAEYSSSIDEIWTHYEYRSMYYPQLIAVLVLMVLEILIKIFIIRDGLRFFPKNILEMGTFAMCTVAVFSEKMEHKTQFTSLGILALFITLASKLQKVPYYGIYVLAFKRTLFNSARFLPMFLLSFVAFLLTFRVRSDENLTLFTNQSVSTAFIKGLTMAMGDFDNDVMGYEDSVTNYLLYLLFIGVMTVIILNLLVGIAVGEITETLEAADIQQISMKIMFVLKVQKSLQILTNNSKMMSNFLNMDYSSYRPHVQNRKIKNILCVKYANKALKWMKEKLESKELEINLVNPQTRLEESIANLAEMTAKMFELINAKLEKQTIEVNNKLNKSKQRLEDHLTEMSRKTKTNFEQTAEDSSSAMTSLEENLKGLLHDVQNKLNKLDMFVNVKFGATRQSIIDHLKNNNVMVGNNFRVVFENLSVLMKVDISEMYKKSNMTGAGNKNEMQDITNMLNALNKRMGKFEKIIEDLNAKTKEQALSQEIELKAKAEEKQQLMTEIGELLENKIGNVAKRDETTQRILQELYDMKLTLSLLEAPKPQKPMKHAIPVSAIMEIPDIGEATVYKVSPTKKKAEKFIEKIPAIAEKIHLFNQPDWSKINEINELKEGKGYKSPRRRSSAISSSSKSEDLTTVPSISDKREHFEHPEDEDKTKKRRSSMFVAGSEPIPAISSKVELFEHPDTLPKPETSGRRRSTIATDSEIIPPISSKRELFELKPAEVDRVQRKRSPNVTTPPISEEGEPPKFNFTQPPSPPKKE